MDCSLLLMMTPLRRGIRDLGQTQESGAWCLVPALTLERLRQLLSLQRGGGDTMQCNVTIQEEKTEKHSSNKMFDVVFDSKK